MLKLWSLLPILVALAAALFTLVPSLRPALPFFGPEELSEEQQRVEAPAAAQNYTYTTVLDDPPVIYLDDFLSEAEIAEILNIRYATPSRSRSMLIEAHTVHLFLFPLKSIAQMTGLRSIAPHLPAASLTTTLLCL